jgi:glycosyltransferase involved in cell wall biosynthesis
MKRIKILTISTSGLARKEGISTVILDNFSRFDKEKFELHMIAAGAYSYELIQEFSAIGVSIKCLPSRKASVYQYIKAFIQLIKAERYDALYIHGSSAIMSIELMIAKLCGCKVRVTHSHNTMCEYKMADKLLRPLFYLLYTDALACGEAAGQWLYGKRKFLVMRNGRDIQKYCFRNEKRTQVRNKLGVRGDTLLVGHVGNFNRQKNQQFVLKIFKELRAMYPDVKLYLMGAGTLLDEVKRMTNELQMSSDVIFTGSIKNVDEMLQAMDVMVLPSIHEGLPLVVVEWQIAALPCLISDKITRECSFSDLVHYMSLDDDCRNWAKKIIEISYSNRKENSKIMNNLTRDSGYDINQNADELQKFFIEKCKG